MIRMTVHFSKGDPSEAEVLFPCFYSISPLQFYRTVFHFKSCFGEGVGTVLIGMLLFHWAFGIVSSTSYFCQQKWLESHKFIGFRFYFCRFCIWFSPCWGRTFRFYAWLDRISFKCGGLCGLYRNQIHDYRFLARPRLDYSSYVPIIS